MPSISAQRAKEWREKNPERSRAVNAAWNARNRIRWHSALAQNSARLRRATPAWADKGKMIDLYETAKRMKAQTGIEYEVDHIIPIKGETVCGLHVEYNLRVIEKSKNKEKGSRLLEL